MAKIRVFRYIESVDAFVITDEFSEISDQLHLTEWHPAVWIGRLFTLDEDYGEHWFDNWDEREERNEKAKELGLDSADLMIVVPGRFVGGDDGPTHSDEIRKAFWTDVLKSLELSHDLIFEMARLYNDFNKTEYPEEYLSDLEEKISQIRASAEH